MQETFDVLHGKIFQLITDEKDDSLRTALKEQLFQLLKAYNTICRIKKIPINHNMNIDQLP